MFKVKSVNSIRRTKAYGMAREYGLSEYFSLEEILGAWEAISDEFGEMWLEPNKELVEEIFGVQLEPKPTGGVVGRIGKSDDDSND